MVAAVAAIDWGWSVVPLHAAPLGRCTCGDPACPTPGRHPRVPAEPFEHHRAGIAEVGRWWRRWPDANLGVVTGMLSGLLVLDVDHRRGGDGTLAHLEATSGPLPSCPEARLAGVERQVFFRHQGPRLPSGPVAPGLTVQADGGLVTIPPSVHSSAMAYHWEVAHEPGGHLVAAAPDWLVDLARRPQGGVEQLALVLDEPTRPGPPSHGAPTLPRGAAVAVVGEFRHQRELLELTGRRRAKGVDQEVVAELVPFLGDSHDRHTLGVRVHGLEVGRVVGEAAERCRPAVVAAIGQYGMATCAARIRGGWDHGHGDVGRFGVTLYLACAAPAT